MLQTSKSFHHEEAGLREQSLCFRLEGLNSELLGGAG